MFDYISIQFSFLTFVCFSIFATIFTISICAGKPKRKNRTTSAEVMVIEDPVIALSPMRKANTKIERPNDDFTVGTPLPNIPMADLPDDGDNTLQDIESIQSEKTMINTKKRRSKMDPPPGNARKPKPSPTTATATAGLKKVKDG